MLKTNVPLEIFWILKDIAEKNHVTNTAWVAKAREEKSSISVIRLSEYSRLYKVQMKMAPAPKKPIKRAFTREIASALYFALTKIIGGDGMKKSIREQLAKEKDPYIILLLISVIKHGDGDKEFIEKLADYAKMLYKANE